MNTSRVPCSKEAFQQAFNSELPGDGSRIKRTPPSCSSPTWASVHNSNQTCLHKTHLLSPNSMFTAQLQGELAIQGSGVLHQYLTNSWIHLRSTAANPRTSDSRKPWVVFAARISKWSSRSDPGELLIFMTFGARPPAYKRLQRFRGDVGILRFLRHTKVLREAEPSSWKSPSRKGHLIYVNHVSNA